jgi:putative transposase
MARLPRFFVPGEVLHVIQRGNNREPIFAKEGDRIFFRDLLLRAIRKHGLCVHAYVLMTNHVHLLLTPARKESVPKALQSIGRHYVQYFNRVRGRSGTLWEGRYRATVVDSERYLLTCMRYIELNPVRAGLATHPELYRWSSYRKNALGVADAMVEPHELYARLGQAEKERRAAYRELFRFEISTTDLAAIREATNKNWALGSEAFKARIASLSGRRPDRLRMGRPARGPARESRV